MTGAQTAGNVTRLPTAAPRKVNQRWNRETRAAREKLQSETPWKGEGLSPIDRRIRQQAKDILAIKKTPAFFIATAILDSLDRDTQDRILTKLLAGVGAGAPDACRHAAAFVQSVVSDYGERYYLLRAMEALQEEGRS